MVAQTCNESWGKVYEMNPYTFFNILAYKIDKNAEEKKQMDNWKKQH